MTYKNQSDWLYGYGVLLTNVQCHMYLYPYHDREYWNIQLKAHLKPHSIKYTSMAIPTIGMYVS